MINLKILKKENYFITSKKLEKRINYMTYLREMKNIDCNRALVRIFNNIKIEEINKFIDAIDCMSNARKTFYKEIINIRYGILKEVYNNLK